MKKERPNLPLFNIHDSLLRTEGNLLYLKQVIEQEFERYIGAVPKLTVELLCPENQKPKMVQTA